MEAKSISLYFKEGSSDKVYNASLQQQGSGWVVNFSFGRRGTALQTGTKTPTPVDYDKALKTYNKLVSEKVGKGYQEELGGSGGSKPATPQLTQVTPSRDTGVRPQLLNEISEQEVEKYITDPAFCAQEKYDGKRRMIIKEGIKVIATNRKGLTIFPSDKITSAVAKIQDDVVLDGEDMGDYMMVFDILKLGHKDLSKEGFQERDKELKSIVKSKNENIRPVYTAYSTAEKRALFEILKKKNAEGIVFKHVKAKYVPGRPNSYGYQLKFKFVSTASCIVTEISTSKRSISLGVYDNGVLIPVGSATVYPNQNFPAVGSVVEVRYLYYFKSGSLFQPVLLGLGNVERDDIDPEACVVGQLKVKRGEIDFDN